MFPPQPQIQTPNPDAASFHQLLELAAGGRLLVLTGAGVSTDSGIPDYRDEQGEWKHRQPMQYREFVGSELARRRYWARSFAGWSRFREARPNAAHVALAALESSGTTLALVTQNVDGLHQAAGSRDVIDLHGRLDRVVCLGCRDGMPRDRFQELLAAGNPAWSRRATAFTPDGDADLGDVDTSRFAVPNCERCGGVLKPDVVFFGEGVPRDRVDAAMHALDQARLLLVVGSSLMVFSGYRFARAAHRRGVPIAIVNKGSTRADAQAAVKVVANAGDVLTRLARSLQPFAPAVGRER